MMVRVLRLMTALIAATIVQGEREPQYDPKILEQSHTICEPIFDGELTCPPKYMMTIPRDIPDTVTFIDLEGNQIGANPQALMGTYSLSRLIVLKLNRNEITAIYPESFTKLETLKRLELRGNYLTKITRYDFDEIPNLAILMLQNNRIRTIQTGAFNKMNQLQSLFLDKNEIRGIGPRSWAPAPSVLTWLSMGTNPSNCSIQRGSYVRCDCAQGHGGEDGSYCVYGGRVVTPTTSLEDITQMLDFIGHSESETAAIELATAYFESEHGQALYQEAIAELDSNGSNQWEEDDSEYDSDHHEDVIVPMFSGLCLGILIVAVGWKFLDTQPATPPRSRRHYVPLLA